MVDADDTDGWVVVASNWQGRSAESAVLSIDWHRIVRVGGVTTDIADDGQHSLVFLENLIVDKRWYLLRQIDAVDKDI